MKKIVFCLILLVGLFLSAKPAQAAVQFRLDPASGNITVGETFPVKILLNTDNNNIGGVALSLSFDADALSVVDADNDEEGVQIEVNNDTFEYPMFNRADNAQGTINFDSGTLDDKNGSNILVATINFSGKAASTQTQVSFTKAEAVNGQAEYISDITSVGAKYDVAQGGNGATPTPTTGEVTPTPTAGVDGGNGGTTPSPTPTVSPDSLPQTGVTTPTLILLAGGMVFLTFGILNFLF